MLAVPGPATPAVPLLPEVVPPAPVPGLAPVPAVPAASAPLAAELLGGEAGVDELDPAVPYGAELELLPVELPDALVPLRPASAVSLRPHAPTESATTTPAAIQSCFIIAVFLVCI